MTSTSERSGDIVHLTSDQIEAGMSRVLGSPTDNGTVAMVVRRPAEDQREILDVAHLDPALGVVGDTWIERWSRRTADGSAHPDMQITLMNARFAELIAGSLDRAALAGDQLYVDLDLTETSLPPWTKLAVGSAVIEVTDQPHTGCHKFTARFGPDATRYTNRRDRAHLRLRGLNARVLEPGRVHPGDTIARISA